MTRSSSREVTVCAFTSMSKTSPRRTVAFFWWRKDDARRGRDLALGHDAGRHLVQHRLEEVVGRPGDKGDVDVGAFEALSGEESSEARSDDHDMVAGRTGGGVTHTLIVSPQDPCSASGRR